MYYAASHRKQEKFGGMSKNKLVDVFLQGDSYSPVGFCLTEVPIGELISGSKGYAMGGTGRRNVKRTHRLFIDLKVYASRQENLKLVNDTIVNASSDTGALYGVKRCAEVA